jgi:hypothetical protein
LEGLAMADQGGEQSKKRTERSYFDLLHFLLSSVPVWIRGSLLFTLMGVIVAAVIMFSITVISGVAVELGPLKISEYRSPLVRNCQSVLAQIPALQQTVDSMLAPMFKQLEKQYADANAMRTTSIQYRGSSESYRQPIGLVADQHAKDMVKEAHETRQDIINTYNKIPDELRTIRTICLDAIKK